MFSGRSSLKDIFLSKQQGKKMNEWSIYGLFTFILFLVDKEFGKY